MADAGVDALLVTHPPNIRYLTGFTGSSAMLLVEPERMLLLTDPRYALQAPAETSGHCEVRVEPVNVWEGLQVALSERPPRSLGCERDHLTIRSAERLRERCAARVEPLSGLVEALRVVKDEGEVASIREAATLARVAYDDTVPHVRPGMTELAVAARLEGRLRELGSEWHPFPTIVASGPRSAQPHARTSSRTIGRGDLLLLDFGAIVNGYCSDITRTVVVGAQPDGKQRECYDAVLGAQRNAIDGLRAGMTGREADRLARGRLEEAGFGQAFRHSLGHGIGLEVHEEPRLAPTAETTLPAGAVVTVEPGVYLEDWGGVRLEDDVRLATDGAALISAGAPELRVVP